MVTIRRRSLIWLLFPTLSAAHAYRADSTTAVVRAGDIRSGEGVLPGFTVQQARLFPGQD